LKLSKNNRRTYPIILALFCLAPASFSLPAAAKILFAELVTVTEHSFELYWATDQPQTCLVKYGGNQSQLDQKKTEPGRAAAYHFLSVNNLQPGVKYFYELECRGAKAPRSRLSPGTLVTQTLPSGNLLFSFAVMTDLHQGETVAGLILLPISWLPALSPGFTWKYPVDNYWAFTARNAVEQINQYPIDFTVVDGDLSAFYSRDEFESAKNLLDHLQKPYYVLRGNHDRVGEQPEDWFKKVFNLEESAYSFSHQGFLFLCLDDTRLEDGLGEIPEKEFIWLEKKLAANKNLPTFIISHRPDELGAPDISKETVARFRAVLEKNPQVIACIHGHGHKAQIKMLKTAGQDLPIIMVPSTKEYPSGFGIIRVFENGLAYNFHRTNCADCLEWSATTRREYFGRAPSVLFGQISDRNLVYPFPEAIRALVKK